MKCVVCGIEVGAPHLAARGVEACVQVNGSPKVEAPEQQVNALIEWEKDLVVFRVQEGLALPQEFRIRIPVLETIVATVLLKRSTAKLGPPRNGGLRS